MAVDLLTRRVSDLCIGKPSLKHLSVSSTVGEGLKALRHSDEDFISVWSCCIDHNKIPTTRASSHEGPECECVGKICIVDVICFLCKHNTLPASAALDSPLSVLLSALASKLVAHVQATSRQALQGESLPAISSICLIKNLVTYNSFEEAIDLILQGVQNLIISIRNSNNGYQQRRRNTAQEFCWLTQEDIIRFFLGSINLFSQIASVSIKSLGLVAADYLSVSYHSPAFSAVELISRSVADQTSVAVVNGDGRLLGEISPGTLCCCDDTAAIAAAIATLSVGELASYIDCLGDCEELMKLVKLRFKERDLGHVYEELDRGGAFDDYSYSDISSNSSASSSRSSSSSDDDSAVEESAVIMQLGRRPRRYSRSWAEPIVCREGSSLLAVMIQAIAHRVKYVWVITNECKLIGIVTFSSIIHLIREQSLR